MRHITAEDDWPDSWVQSHQADRAEWWGWKVNLGYTWAYRQRFDRSVGLVERYLPAGSTILDLAAGQGNFTLRLAEDGYSVTWNDLRSDLEGYVRLKHERGDVTYHGGNAFDLELRAFDAVLANEIIEHVAHPDEFLRKVAALLKPGGLLFLSTPNGGYFRTGLPTFSEITDPTVLESEQFRPGSEGHLFLLTNRELSNLAQSAGLELLELSNFTSPIMAGRLGLGRVLRFFPEGIVKAVDDAIDRMLPSRLRCRLLVHTCVVLRCP